MVELTLSCIRFCEHSRFAARRVYTQQAGRAVRGGEHDGVVRPPVRDAEDGSGKPAYQARWPTRNGHLPQFLTLEETEPSAIERKERRASVHNPTDGFGIEAIERADHEWPREEARGVDHSCAVG